MRAALLISTAVLLSSFLVSCGGGSCPTASVVAFFPVSGTSNSTAQFMGVELSNGQVFLAPAGTDFHTDQHVALCEKNKQYSIDGQSVTGVDPIVTRAFALLQQLKTEPIETEQPKLAGYVTDVYRQNSDFAHAYDAVISRLQDEDKQIRAGTWYKQASGVTTPMRLVVDKGGRQLVAFSLCKPDDCDSNQIVGYYDPASRKSVAGYYGLRSSLSSTDAEVAALLAVFRETDDHDAFPLSGDQLRRTKAAILQDAV